MSTCWPARYANGRSGRTKKLVIPGVCMTRRVIVAFCHRTAGATAATSVIGVPLLPPGVAVDVVAAQLPEPGLVARGELQALHPLGRLPEVEVRDQQPRRTAVVGLERRAVVAERHH